MQFILMLRHKRLEETVSVMIVPQIFFFLQLNLQEEKKKIHFGNSIFFFKKCVGVKKDKKNAKVLVVIEEAKTQRSASTRTC